jgi:outer membrane protein OmpA-like peptidoglycan-associated protein
MGLALNWSGAAFAADCNALKPQAEAALQANNLAGEKSLYPQVRDSCDAAYTDWLGRQIAAQIFNQAVAGAAPDPVRLAEALTYGRPWQVLATLGDLAADRKDWRAAATNYQGALVEIADANRTPARPSADLVLALKRKAEQAGLLAPDYVSTPRGRDGENEGLAASSIRGISITSVAMPVEFITAKTDFTDKGLKAAEDMASFLKNENPQPVRLTLIGHADPRGAAALNQDLSRRRAAALGAFLTSRGISSTIRVEGRGSSEPFTPDQESKYSQDELYQLDRRVELRRE